MGRRGAVGFLHTAEKSERGVDIPPLQGPGGVKDLGFSFPPALAAYAALVENGHSDHCDLWTYLLFDTAGHCKSPETFS